jgi:hypothetical protein
VRRVSKLRSTPRDGGDGQYTLRKCGVVRREKAGNVRLRVVDGSGYAVGVVHCGSVWGCPVCAATIRGRRAVIYGESAARWIADGNSIFMVTLTFPHDMGMPLGPMWDLVSGGASSLTSSARWREVKASLGEPDMDRPRPSRKTDPAGYAAWQEERRATQAVFYRRAIEQTYGNNGWHPHCHMLIYVRGEVGAEGLALLTRHFSTEWPRWVTRHGYRLPDDRHGVDVKPCAVGSQAGEYIVKTQDGGGVANEIVRSDLKTGRSKGKTPFELLAEYGNTGRQRLLDLWWEFEQASKDRRAITQSQGLPDILGENDLTDEELANEEVDGADVAEVSGETWADVCAKGLEAAIFEATAGGGLAAISELLSRYSCGPAWPPAEMRGS